MIVANRYAASLMELATEQKKTEVVKDDMKLVEQVYKENREFQLLVKSPVIKTDKKITVFNELFKGKISDLSLSFIKLVISKRREAYLNEIASAFNEQYRKSKNIFSAVVTSAKGLDNATRQKMLDLVKGQLNGEVELVEKVDPNTIGGFILRIGDRQIDRSVSRQLANMKKELISKELN